MNLNDIKPGTMIVTTSEEILIVVLGPYETPEGAGFIARECNARALELRWIWTSLVENYVITVPIGKAPIATIRSSKPDEIRVNRGDYVRASGDVICDLCRCKLYDHPTVKGYEWLTRRCDGSLVKL